MAKNREGSINLFGAVQAKTEDGIVAHADGIAVEYDANGKPTKTLAQAIEDGSLGGGGGSSTDNPANRPVPSSGLVEKVYFNTSLSVEEVTKILDTLTYHTLFSNTFAYSFLCLDNEVSNDGLYNKLLVVAKNDTMITIMDYINSTVYWINEINTELGNTTIGWQEFTNPIEINAEVLNSFNFIESNLSSGEQNDKLKNLISIDPFTNSSPLEVINVEELPSALIEVEGTAVPSSGQVGKIYFNTKLSVEEVNEILSSLDYVEGVLNAPAYAVATTADMSQGLVILSQIMGDGSRIFTIMTGSGETVYYYLPEDEDIDFNVPLGWYVSEVELNISNMLSLLAPQVNMIIQNDKLKNLISTTPFEGPNPDIELDKLYRTPITDGYKYNQFVNGEWKELSYNGIETKELKEKPLNPVAIPNEGLLSQVYVNTSLSYDEVLDIVESVPYDTSSPSIYFVFTNQSERKMIRFEKYLFETDINKEIGYGIGFSDYEENASGPMTPIWLDEIYCKWVNTTLGTNYTAGWQNFANPLTFGNINIVSTDENGNPVGHYNSELKNLFSLNPYLTDIDAEKIYKLPITKTLKGTLVSNEGTVDKIYFNTNLTATEVHNIFSVLPFMQTPLLRYPLYPVLFSATGSPIIMVVKAENTYEITIVKDLSTSDFEYAYVGDSTLGTGNWILSEYEINSELISEYMGLPIGSVNSQLRNLISTTPFKTKKVGTEFYHLRDGQMVKLGGDSSKLPKDLSVIVEYSGDIQSITMTDEDWEKLHNSSNAYIIINSQGTQLCLHKKFTYSNILMFHGYLPTEIAVIITKTANGYTYERNFVQHVDSINSLVIDKDTQLLTLNYTWDGAPTKASVPVDIETLYDSYNLATSKAVRNYISAYMTIHYGNGDTEEF